MPATLLPASRWANIHRTCGAVAGSGVEAVQTPSPAGVRPVRVRAGINEAIAIGRAPAQVATLITRLDQHGCGGAEPSAEDFALGLVTEQHDQRSMGRLVEIYRSVGLR